MNDRRHTRDRFSIFAVTMKALLLASCVWLAMIGQMVGLQ